MNGNGQVELSGAIQRIWGKLLDPDVLSNCIVGCQALKSIEDGKYRADLSIGIAAVKGKYDATIELADIRELEGYKLIVHGEGATGYVDAVGLIELHPFDDGKVGLTYQYTADVGGKIAAVGQRMLGGVAKLLINDFFKRLKKEIERCEQSA